MRRAAVLGIPLASTLDWALPFFAEAESGASSLARRPAVGAPFSEGQFPFPPPLPPIPTLVLFQI